MANKLRAGIIQQRYQCALKVTTIKRINFEP